MFSRGWCSSLSILFVRDSGDGWMQERPTDLCSIFPSTDIIFLVLLILWNRTILAVDPKNQWLKVLLRVLWLLTNIETILFGSKDNLSQKIDTTNINELKIENHEWIFLSICEDLMVIGFYQKNKVKIIFNV